MEKPSTRLSSTIFGLGSKITLMDSQISGSRLPTNLQVLRCLMYHIDEGAQTNRTRWESAKLVLSQVTLFYEKANVPMISERKACEKMIKLLDENAKLRVIPLKRRLTPGILKKVKQMENKLSQTFPLWPVNVEKEMNNAEDLNFLQSMKGDRTATFGSHDKILADKVKRRQEREMLQVKRHKRILDQMSASFGSSGFESTTDDSDEDSNKAGLELSDDRADSDVPSELAVAGASNCTRSHHRITHTGTTVFIQHDIMRNSKLVALATRLKMTPTQQAAYTKALIVEAGGDLSKIVTSYSTADKARRIVAKQISIAYREQWLVPKFATLHWDSKLLPTLSNKNVAEERLTIVVGNSHEMKLLGVPAYPPGTDRKSGDIISRLTHQLLTSWKCAESIVNMTFDTTASNTGHVTAACISIQQKVGRALLWSACRHHVGEIILSHVFDHLKIEASKSPDVTLFTRFRKNFALLDSVDCQLVRIDSSSFSELGRNAVNDHRANALRITKSVVNQGSIRDDYLEFAKLCLVFLDNQDVSQAVTFNRPGALHKARWMAKLIYSIKICLLELQIEQLPWGTITAKHQVSKVRDFVNFVTLIYSTWWMTCNSAVDAPWHDLKFFHSLLAYEAVHSLISRSAITAFKNHLWYLTEEMVPLALWSSKVPPADKRALADAMLAIDRPHPFELFKLKNRFGTGLGKPKFPTALNSSTTLSNLVGHDSWYIFYLLQLDSQFLTEDVKEWPNSISYQASLTNLQALNVVNDCAERGVKVSADFLESAKGEEHFQNVLQVVEQERHHQPNLRGVTKCKRQKLSK